ncbi:MAG: NAD-dependent epimerase/dehydratase family protein [Planctomycetaceae bacterium]|nr:NAD-dependent epimerase/dehydratase family protein [Planctomycetaceae bacterium]
MFTLVTGGGGFLGQYLVRQLLDRGDQVRVFSRKHHAIYDRLPVDVKLGDIRNVSEIRAACQDVDVVYHTAAMAGLSCRWEPFFETNTLGTLYVIDACTKNGVKKLIYTSSPSVVFNGKNQEGIDETVPYPDSWLAHYSSTKALAERIVLSSNGRDGLLTCALRPHLIWGPGDSHLFPRLIARARMGKLRRIGGGKNMIDITYVENAAHAHVLAGDALFEGSPVAGSSYFVSQGQPVNCWDFINELLAIAKLPLVTKSISYFSAWCKGLLLENWCNLFRLHSEPAMTRFLVTQLARSHWFNISRAKNDFGYRPIVSTEEGLARLAAEMNRE